MYFSVIVGQSSAFEKSKVAVLPIQSDFLAVDQNEELTSRIRSTLLKSMAFSVADFSSMQQAFYPMGIKPSDCIDTLCQNQVIKNLELNHLIVLYLQKTDSTFELQADLETALGHKWVYHQEPIKKKENSLKKAVENWSQKWMDSTGLLSQKKTQKIVESNIFLQRPVEISLALASLIQFSAAQIYDSKARETSDKMKSNWDLYKYSNGLKADVQNAYWDEYLHQRERTLATEKTRNYYWLGAGVSALLSATIWYYHEPSRDASPVSVQVSPQSMEFIYAFSF